MNKKKQKTMAGGNPIQNAAISNANQNERIFSVPDKYLDSEQLHQLEQAFRQWIDASPRDDVRDSRRRIFIIFLVIRYTGAKLSEVLGLDLFNDIDFNEGLISFGRQHDKDERTFRTVNISGTLGSEIKTIMDDPAFDRSSPKMLQIDPGFVRRKFYEQAESCGLPKQLGAPEILRKSRAVELMQNNMPLPAVQMLLGHSSPHLISSYVSFSEEEIHQLTRFYMEREASRKTSARNSFFGKIQTIQQGDIQSRVELVTLSGNKIATVITNDSLKRLGLKKGTLITAEVKAPWVMVQKTKDAVESSADNIIEGVVERIMAGEINTEFIVRISDGTEICALVTSESSRRLGLQPGDRVNVMFNSYSVVILSV